MYCWTPPFVCRDGWKPLRVLTEFAEEDDGETYFGAPNRTVLTDPPLSISSGSSKVEDESESESRADRYRSKLSRLSSSCILSSDG